MTRDRSEIDPRSIRDRPEIDPRLTRNRPEIYLTSYRDRPEIARDCPRSTRQSSQVLDRGGLFVPQGFYPPRAEIDPRSTRDRHERSTQHSIPQSPLSGGPLPPHPERPCPSRVANGERGGVRNAQGRPGRGGSILKTADRGGVFSHRVLPEEAMDL